jgi:hypothetical protein
MSNVHATVGTLVIIGYLVMLILNIATAIRGRGYSWQQYVSYGAATLLALQYLLGFSLLGEGKSVSAFHFIIALCAILPLGLEHAYANAKPSVKERAQYAALANFLTLVIVLIAYMIGQSN